MVHVHTSSELSWRSTRTPDMVRKVAPAGRRSITVSGLTAVLRWSRPTGRPCSSMWSAWTGSTIDVAYERAGLWLALRLCHCVVLMLCFATLSNDWRDASTQRLTNWCEIYVRVFDPRFSCLHTLSVLLLPTHCIEHYSLERMIAWCMILIYKDIDGLHAWRLYRSNLEVLTLKYEFIFYCLLILVSEVKHNYNK